MAFIQLISSSVAGGDFFSLISKTNIHRLQFWWYTETPSCNCDWGLSSSLSPLTFDCLLLLEFIFRSGLIAWGYFPYQRSLGVPSLRKCSREIRKTYKNWGNPRKHSLTIFWSFSILCSSPIETIWFQSLNWFFQVFLIFCGFQTISWVLDWIEAQKRFKGSKGFRFFLIGNLQEKKMGSTKLGLPKHSNEHKKLFASEIFWKNVLCFP